MQIAVVMARVASWRARGYPLGVLDRLRLNVPEAHDMLAAVEGVAACQPRLGWGDREEDRLWREVLVTAAALSVRVYGNGPVGERLWSWLRPLDVLAGRRVWRWSRPAAEPVGAVFGEGVPW